MDLTHPGPRNLITDVAGLRVGQAHDDVLKSGVSVVLGDAPMVAGVHVMGGAPGTRETDLLRPEATVGGVDAIVLSGGSAFGLAAATGVMERLRAHGRGYPAAGHLVPIVPGAIIFDLANGGAKDWDENPYPALGSAALEAAGSDITLGSHGAGTGAMTAGLKGGIGSASVVLPSGVSVGALVVVNAFGSVVQGDGPEFWAAPFELGNEFGGLGVAARPAGFVRTKHNPGGNTTIAVVATDATLDKPGATRMATAAHDGIARAIVPAHTPSDGDLVFACSTGHRPLPEGDTLLLGHAAATCLARAIARGVHAATPSPGDPFTTWADAHG
jgi:D-aminopeptidase